MFASPEEHKKLDFGSQPQFQALIQAKAKEINKMQRRASNGGEPDRMETTQEPPARHYNRKHSDQVAEYA